MGEWGWGVGWGERVPLPEKPLIPWFYLSFDCIFTHILPIVCGHFTREVMITWLTVMWQSETIYDKKKKKKKRKKKKRDLCLLCAIQKETGDIRGFYCCPYVFLTGNDLGVLGVFFSRKSWYNWQVCQNCWKPKYFIIQSSVVFYSKLGAAEYHLEIGLSVNKKWGEIILLLGQYYTFIWSIWGFIYPHPLALVNISYLGW